MKTAATSLLSAFLIFLLPLIAFADCAGFAKYGIYDVRSSMNKTERASAFRNWFCSRQFQSVEQANKSSAEIGIPIDDIPIKLGFSGDAKTFGQWESSYCSDQYNSSTDKILTESYVSTVNDKLVAVIAECMKQAGVHAMVEQGENPLSFRFTATYVRFDVEPLPMVTSFSTSASPPLECEKDQQISKGVTIKTSGINLLCKRRSDEAIDIVFNTTAPKLIYDTPMSIRAAPPPPPPNAMVKAEACRQLFSGPYDLESITKLYADRIKLYRSSRLDEEKEIRNRYPIGDQGMQVQAFKENKDLADDVRRDIDTRVNQQVGDADWLVDYVQRRKADCGSSITSSTPARSNPAVGRCQQTLLAVGSDTLNVYKTSIPMANTINFWQTKRNASWQAQPEPDKDPSLHMPAHRAARDLYKNDQDSMDASAKMMIDDEEKLKEDLVLLPDACRF